MTINKIIIILLASILSSSYQAIAQGDLLITPKRVVFEGNKQRETLNLVNIGKDTATYSISFIQYNMEENGSFKIINEPDSGQMFADPYLRIFPRKVTLAPGEPQVIMLQYRRKANMLNGEYRSHLYFRSEENYLPLGLGKPVKDTTLLSVQLIPIYGISIPIIIRTGEINTKVHLGNLQLDTRPNKTQALKITINRAGNISVYGDIKIEYIPLQGKAYEIGSLKGIGVYTNINKRDIIIKLNKTTDQPLTNGKLKVTYISNNKKKKVVYAVAEFVIGSW